MNLFIDTNVLLSFYHLTSDDLEELRKLIVLVDKGQIKLILPRQVINEFQRKRENKIAHALKRLRGKNLKLQFPQICKDHPDYIELREQQSKYGKSYSELMKKLSRDIEKHQFKADVITSELFEKATVIEYDEEIMKNSKLRMRLGNPFWEKKSLRDAINWETKLKHNEDESDIHLVTDDKDYYSALDGATFNELLLTEWKEKKKSNIHCYRRLSTFFKEHYPDIKMASENEKELLIKEFAGSDSFISTHVSVGKLSEYLDFTIAQIDEIIEATISNTQIHWIIKDEDVKEFLTSAIEGKEDKLNEESLIVLSEMLKYDDEEEGGAPTSEEDIPY